MKFQKKSKTEILENHRIKKTHILPKEIIKIPYITEGDYKIWEKSETSISDKT